MVSQHGMNPAKTTPHRRVEPRRRRSGSRSGSGRSESASRKSGTSVNAKSATATLPLRSIAVALSLRRAPRPRRLGYSRGGLDPVAPGSGPARLACRGARAASRAAELPGARSGAGRAGCRRARAARQHSGRRSGRRELPTRHCTLGPFGTAVYNVNDQTIDMNIEL